MTVLNEQELIDMQSLFTQLTEEASNEESVIRARGFDLVRPPFKVGVQNRVIAKLYMRILALESTVDKLTKVKTPEAGTGIPDAKIK